MRKIIQFGITFCIGISVGFGLTRFFGNSAKSPELVQNKTRPAKEKLSKGREWKHFSGNARQWIDQASRYAGARDQKYFLYRSLEDQPPEKLGEFIEDLYRLEPSSQMLTAVLQLWAEQDSDAALAWAQRQQADPSGEFLVAVIYGAAEKGIPNALQLVNKIKEGAERNLANSIIANKMAETDPAAAFRLLQSIPDSAHHSSSFVIFDNWARQDPKAALEAISKLPESNRDNATLNYCIALSDADPVGAMGLAMQLKEPSVKKRAVSSVLQQWAWKDVLAAAEWFKSLPQNEQSNVESQGLFLALTHKGPQLAIALMESLTGKARITAISTIAPQWADLDLDAAWQWANKFTRFPEKDAAICGTAYAMAKAGPEKALVFLGKITNLQTRINFLKRWLAVDRSINTSRLEEICGKLQHQETIAIITNSELVRSLVNREPARFAKFLVNANIPPDSQAWSDVAPSFAANQPSEAYAWAQTLPKPLQHRVIYFMISALAQHDPADAMAKAQALPTDYQRNSFSSIIPTWLQRDRDSLEQALPTLNGEAKTLAEAALDELRLSQDPATVADRWLPIIHSGDQQEIKKIERSITTLATQWTTVDPASAAAWVTKLPDGIARQSYLTYVVQTWSRIDPATMLPWLKELPTSREKDLAISNLVRSFSYTDPENSLVLAAQVEDQPTRESAYASALHRLLEKDHEAGRKAVDLAPISAESKKRLLLTPK